MAQPTYTAVDVPAQVPQRTVYPHEIAPPGQREVQKPSPLEAAKSWLDIHKTIPNWGGPI